MPINETRTEIQILVNNDLYIRLAVFNGPSLNPPPHRRKNLADIFYTRRVIANFVPNFVAMATGVGRGNAMGSIQWPIFENPSIDTKSRRYLLHKPSYSPFCHKFCCHGNQGRSGAKLNDTIRLAIPENHTTEPKIMTILYTAKVMTVLTIV